MLFDPSKAKIIRASELAATPLSEDSFVLNPRILPRGGQMLIAGEQEIGKTWLCLNLIRSLTGDDRGELFDNAEWVTNPSRVLFVEPEVKLTMRERMDFIFAGHPGLDRFDYFFPPPFFNLNKDDCRQWFAEEIQKREYDLIVLDSVGRMASYQENSNDSAAELLSTLRYVQGERAAILWTMHFGKPPGDRDGWDPLSVDNIRGASKWADDIDAILTLARQPGRAVPDAEHETWTLRYSWEKTRHMLRKPDRGEIVFNARNDGRMVWRPRPAGPGAGRPPRAPREDAPFA